MLEDAKRMTELLIAPFAKIPSDLELRERLHSPHAGAVDLRKSDDLETLRSVLREAIERVYLPTNCSVQLASTIVSRLRAFCLRRYEKPVHLVEVSFAKADDETMTDLLGEDDEIPITLIHGIPGSGKTRLCEAIRRLLPDRPSIEIPIFADQSWALRSIVFMRFNPTFSLLNWLKHCAVEFGMSESQLKHYNSVEDKLALLARLFFLHGVAAILIDEAQFASGKTSAQHVAKVLLTLRKLKVPLVVFSNSDLVVNIRKLPKYLTHRLLSYEAILAPMSKEEGLEMLRTLLGLLPHGHHVNLKEDALSLHTLGTWLPRANAILVEVAGTKCASGRKSVGYVELFDAATDARFAETREVVRIIGSPGQIDARKHPELTAANDDIRARERLLGSFSDRDLTAAATVSVMAGHTASEREAVSDSPRGQVVLGNGQRKYQNGNRPPTPREARGQMHSGTVRMSTVPIEGLGKHSLIGQEYEYRIQELIPPRSGRPARESQRFEGDPL
jgi:energy-coupling factor transporter ATP-binding protein EcfA2